MKNSEVSLESDLKLWKSAVSQTPGALETLLRSKQDLIFRFCMSQLKDPNTAVDATQETAVRLIENLQRFSGTGRLDTWILGIANNVCREHRRKSQKFSQLSDPQTPPPTAPPETTTENHEDSTKLKQAIEALPARQQQAIVLRYFESLPIAEVAKIMEVSIGTVKATLNQTIQKLKLKFLDLE